MKDPYINIEVLDWDRAKEINICIVTIITEELTEVVNKYDLHVKNAEYIHWEGKHPEYPNVNIHCYQQNESGNFHSQSLTGYLLEREYDYYFYVGTAGLIDGNLYDVVIANQIICLEKGANTMTGREYDGKAIEITEKEKNIINTFLAIVHNKKQTIFNVDTAPIFSGENVEKNPEQVELKVATEFARHLAVIDMESFGVFQALRFYEAFKEKKGNPLFVVRGISDKGDDCKNGVYEDGLKPKERKVKAMENVLEILNAFIIFLIELG